MAAKVEPRNGIKHTWDLGENGWNTGMDENLLKIGLVGMHLSVLDKDISTPPGTPTDGDSYLVGASATGDWAGLENYILIWDDDIGDWRSYAPRKGWMTFVEDEDAIYIYKAAAWEAYSSGGAGGGHTIQEGGVDLTARANLNFIGFDVADNGVNDSTDISLSTSIGGIVSVPEVSDKESFTPSIAGWSNTTWTGQKWRVANMLFMQINGVLTGAPTGTITLTVPDSLELDSNVFSFASNNHHLLAEITYFDAAPGIRYSGAVVPLSTTTIRFLDADLFGSATPSSPFGFASADIITATISIPIAGWNTSKQINVNPTSSYTVATVPDATTQSGAMVLVTDETGGAVMAFSDGTNWRRVTDRAVIS